MKIIHKIKIYIGCSESTASSLFSWKAQQTAEERYLIVFFNIATTISCAFLPVMNKSLHAVLVKICTRGADPLFHGCYDDVIARKMLPMQSISHQPKQMELKRCQIQAVWWVW